MERRWISLALILYSFTSVLGGSLLDRQKRQLPGFSLFSIVQFPNDQCVIESDNTMMGTCLSTDECSDYGGTADGNCASGFGVCCMFTKDACSDTVTRNCTYITNPSYPSSYSISAATTCSFTINPDISGDVSDIDICQIRLDFTNFQIASPSTTTGQCATDTLTSTGQSGVNPPVVCGTLTDQHMYIETGRSSSDTTLAFSLDGTTSTTRTWKIKVSFIECISTSKAPTDCVQYYTGISQNGVMSYNFPGGQMLQSQNFATCVRKERGYCSIEWMQSSSTSPDPFQLDETTAPGDRGLSTCANAFIMIPNVNQELAGTDVFCGGTLNEVDTATTAGKVRSEAGTFYIRTWSDDASQGTVSGYNLNYMQVPCGNS